MLRTQPQLNWVFLCPVQNYKLSQINSTLKKKKLNMKYYSNISRNPTLGM